MNQATTQEQLEVASLQHQAGRLQEAEQNYRAILAEDPENADAYNGLGLLALQIGQYDVARDLFQMAVEIVPTDATFLCNLGTALYGMQETAAAREAFEKALEADEGCAAAHLKLGILEKAEGEYGKAAERLDQAVAAAPRDPEAFAHLADALLHLGRYDTAETIARAAVNLDNRHQLGLFTLASALQHQARPQEALGWAQRLVRHNPGEARYYRLLAACLVHSGLRKEGCREARKAIALAPDSAEGYGLLAEALGGQGEWQEGLRMIERAMELAPGDERLIATKAGLLELCGRQEEAFTLIHPLIQGREKVTASVLDHYLTLARRLGRQQEVMQIVERALSNGKLNSQSHYNLYFSAGELCDDVGQYDRAFSFFQKANQLKPRHYNGRHMREQFDALQLQFTPKLFQEMDAFGSESQRPIFIIGMPRSGTSLTEQILASHPQVFAAGELHEIHNVALALPGILGTATPYPECIQQLTESVTKVAAKQYLDFIAEIAPEPNLQVTDKMPQNFVYLGLIAILFPNAKVIHCRRNPLDTCLSCYFQNFAAAGLQFAYNLEHLGHYYRLYRRLMSHWREVLPIPMHELRYERLTADPEIEVRKLLEFCDLEWDDACLDHTRSGVQTKTASYDQVRQPIYTKSVARWKHYKKHLKPLIKTLGEELAYE